MTTPLGQVLIYALIPAAATIVGGSVATIRPPGPRVGSAIEHFGGGVILAAAVDELLPDATRSHSAGPVIAGFALAVVLMLAVKSLITRFAPEDESDNEGDERPRLPLSLIVVAGVDTLIDGVLLGIGFIAGAKQGVLLTLALAVETLALGLSVAVALRPAGVSRTRIISTTAVLSFLFAVGAVVGAALLGGISGAALTVLFAFGAAVLIYLVTEELLVEAHEVPETAVATALFFVGFVALTVLNITV